MVLVDASTFFLLVREAEEDKAIGILSKSRVTTLTDYELGNVLWKEQRVSNRLSLAEIRQLARKTKRILQSIIHVSIQPEAFEETLELAVQEKLSYYDASYIQTAKKLNLTLATEDHRLSNVAKRHVKTSNAEEILKENT